MKERTKTLPAISTTSLTIYFYDAVEIHYDTIHLYGNPVPHRLPKYIGIREHPYLDGALSLEIPGGSVRGRCYPNRSHLQGDIYSLSWWAVCNHDHPEYATKFDMSTRKVGQEIESGRGVQDTVFGAKYQS